MASSTPKEQYFVIIPDTPTADRPRVRPLHMAQLSHAPASHTVFMGGAVLSSQPSSTTSPVSEIKMTGSAMILEFDTANEKTLEDKKKKVMEYLKRDPYTLEGVWDLDKVRIEPFKVGFSGEPGVEPR